ncbi:Uncharacterised protein [Bordetella pertussis]|nr:Uncharacterised protein [Bordetella pertussis]
MRDQASAARASETSSMPGTTPWSATTRRSAT